jgi:hypothetical protein
MNTRTTEDTGDGWVLGFGGEIAYPAIKQGFVCD